MCWRMSRTERPGSQLIQVQLSIRTSSAFSPGVALGLSSLVTPVVASIQVASSDLATSWRNAAS